MQVVGPTSWPVPPHVRHDAHAALLVPVEYVPVGTPVHAPQAPPLRPWPASHCVGTHAEAAALLPAVDVIVAAVSPVVAWVEHAVHALFALPLL